MPSQRRIFDPEFKLQVLNEIDTGSSVAETARRHAVHVELIYRWRRQQRKYADRAFAGRGNAYSDEAKIAQLERTSTLQNPHDYDYDDFILSRLNRVSQLRAQHLT